MPTYPPSTTPRNETGRIEAFSDGVFAIVLTLLVFNIRAPQDMQTPQALVSALLEQWPSYLAFIASFALIGIMWLNHHRLFNLIHYSDTGLMLTNLLLLLAISLVPFPTSLVAEYLGHPGQRVAITIYNSLSVLIAIFFNFLWRWSSYKNRLLDPEADPALTHAINRGYLFGPIAYLIALGLGFIQPTASLLLNLTMAAFFALPLRFMTKLRL